MAEPTRSRAVLSTADFELLREAVLQGEILTGLSNDAVAVY